MASSLLLNTATPTFGELFTNGRTFSVPRYQRSYKWTQDNWEELWEDLEHVASFGREHYMGAIVLKTHEGRKHFEVIDGQQRLVTLTVLVLAAVKCFEEWASLGQGTDSDANRERARLYRDRFLRAKDAASLAETSRLELSKADQAFFHSNLIQLREPVARAKLRESEKLMWDCFCYFHKQFDEKYGQTRDAPALSGLLDAASDRLLFIQILVSDELDAYTVFETLNARGTQLTVTDLLKNFIFSRFGVDENAITVAEDQWTRIIGQKEKEFPKLLRHHWNSHHGVTRPPRLFKEIRASVKDYKDAQNLLTKLERVSVLYSALNNPSDDLWEGQPKVRKHVKEISLFGVTQCYPLLFAVWETNQDIFEAVLRICSVISFRYIIIGRQNTQPMERAYVEAAIKVRSGALMSPLQVFDSLKKIYISDDQFVEDFTRAVIPTPNNKELVRYILIALENQIAQNKRSFDDGATIEHILPENMDAYWDEKFPDMTTEIYRLGNYTLLEAGINSRVGRSGIETKRIDYQKSSYSLSNKFGWTEWNRDNLSARQAYMANTAKAIWQINF